MAELGPDAPRYHREIGELAAEARLDALVAVGELARGYAARPARGRRWAPTQRGATPPRRRLVAPGDCVLVKASRAVGLERVAEALAAVKPLEWSASSSPGSSRW